ncbi:MAG: TonB-dependent receptor [Acidobacteriales bacterium]|nr:TonB-dependent receptor [Terriglobales bacterium]
MKSTACMRSGSALGDPDKLRNPYPSVFGRLRKLGLFILLLGSPALAERDLTELSLKELLNTEVTSASKQGEKVARVAAAIFVITQNDIRHSGATTIPDLLRMVPGLDVAQINPNSWAISARGFNHEFSDKLLVLIDGRTVYTPRFGGTYWDTQDVVLEDIERIEVIRGPGATVWGANAVNGVIDIITKKASDTLGGLVKLGGGTQELGFGTAQYGAKVGANASYRIFAKGFDRNHFPNLGGENGQDGWHLLHSGFRADASLSQTDSLTMQGDIYGGQEGSQFRRIVSISPPVNQNVNGSAALAGGNVLGRWNHIFSSRSDITLQGYFDRYEREGPKSRESRDTYDLDLQDHLTLGKRNDFMWGAEYRYTADHTVGTIDQSWLPATRTLHLLSTYVQDEISLKPDRVFLTLGTKLQNNYFTGWDFDPSVRVVWTPGNGHSFWAAVSRADRTPSRRNIDAHIDVSVFPGPGGTPAELTVLGNPDEESEHVIANEVGGRGQFTSWLSADVALFFNHYSDPATREPGPPFLALNSGPAHLEYPSVWSNKMHGTTQGVEVSANWKVSDHWTLRPGYALLEMHLRTDPSSQDTKSVAATEGGSPRHQLQLRSHMTLPNHFAWDANVYYVGRLPAEAVPSYTRLDTEIVRQLGEQLELSFVGQNLLRDHHLESNDSFTAVTTSQVKRGGYVKITWWFR